MRLSPQIDCRFQCGSFGIDCLLVINEMVRGALQPPAAHAIRPKGATMNQVLRVLAFAMSLATLSLGLGCGGETGGTGGTGSGNATFAQVQQIFSNTCTTAACHGAAVPAVPGFDLSAGVSYGKLVGVPSIERPSEM